MAEKRKCTKTTKAGKPCRGTPIAATDFKTCLAHAPEEVRDKLRFGKEQEGAGRPPKPKATEIARRLVEENIAAVQRPYWRTLGYDVKIGPEGPYLVELDEGGAKVYGTSQKDGSINVSDYDDLGAMMTASDKLQDRAFGRPKQSTELSGEVGGTNTAQLEREIERLTERLAEMALDGSRDSAGA